MLTLSTTHRTPNRSRKLVVDQGIAKEPDLSRQSEREPSMGSCRQNRYFFLSVAHYSKERKSKTEFFREAHLLILQRVNSAENTSARPAMSN